MSTVVFAYGRAHTSVFAADNMRNLLRDIVAWSGLDQTQLVDDWSVVGNAVRTWLRSGDLLEVTLEFFLPGSNVACGRWDLPISYDGSGVDDDMWVAKSLVRQTIAKVGKPPANALYRVVLTHRPTAESVAGMYPATLRSVDGLVSRQSGTAIATPDIMATLKYWRAA